MGDENKDNSNKVITLIPHKGKMVRPELIEQNLRDFLQDALLLAYKINEAQKEDAEKAAEIYADRIQIDPLIEITNELKTALISFVVKGQESVFNTKIEIPEPLPDLGPQRFLAWSLIATSLSPRYQGDRVESALRNASDDVVDTYLKKVYLLSEDLVTDHTKDDS